ncbi:DUF58 domain-containing protein [Demequina lignilytica]|uniref:DUF58 domain-containing protein n=1 Tax=Demequina lignilytica TaxID=3051663 RepID=A0AB35MDW6_9MICO|nr:DUF58 domain-containing protein [Demequina sp. SYSU T0a273]MDN4481958.1 DUF58 domain-containing protein [Demequina sp. SYSU T0a273]
MLTAPERLLARLEWTVLRRLDGRLLGAHRSLARGHGIDVASVRPYVPGDDARHMDWAVTARLDEPHVRRHEEDREVTAWLVIDSSASMRFGAAERDKSALTAELATAITRLLTSGGDRAGAILYDGGQARVLPARSGRDQALLVARAVTDAPDPRHGGETDLAAMLRLAATSVRRRSLIVVLSDLLGAEDWERDLRRLTHRHEVVVIRITDPVEDELPELGTIALEDAETGEQLLVDASDPAFRARYAQEVAARDAALRTAVRRAGAEGHSASTAEDLVSILVRVVESARWRQGRRA